MNSLEIVEAGLVPYREVLEWQRQLADDRIGGRLSHDVLLLVEHPPVVTLGRTSKAAHLLRPSGIDVFEVERGGDVTFHGPGQLVGYPILDLNGYKRDLHWYLRALEQALIDGLGLLGIPADRNPGYTGVWTRGKKLASIGIHVKQWVTWHGFALNVTTDLADFDRIVPCGIQGVVMTSVERETGNGKQPAPSRRPERSEGAARGETLWRESVAAVIRGFQSAFGVDPILKNGPGESLRLSAASDRAHA